MDKTLTLIEELEQMSESQRSSVELEIIEFQKKFRNNPEALTEYIMMHDLSLDNNILAEVLNYKIGPIQILEDFLKENDNGK